jgi:hypothetical protein
MEYDTKKGIRRTDKEKGRGQRAGESCGAGE